MIIQKKPDYLLFASDAKNGELVNFPDVKRGWGVTIDQTASKPPMEWMNGAFNRIDANTLYLLQQGVPEWDALVLYPTNAIIKYNAVLYIAKIQNNNVTPTDTTKWTKFIQDASTSQAGIVKLSSATDSESETIAASSKAVKIAYDLANVAKKTAETDGTTTTKNRVKLNSSINSASETEAATPKAVSDAYSKLLDEINIYVAMNKSTTFVYTAKASDNSVKLPFAPSSILVCVNGLTQAIEKNYTVEADTLYFAENSLIAGDIILCLLNPPKSVVRTLITTNIVSTDSANLIKEGTDGGALLRNTDVQFIKSINIEQ
ncbi:phage tail protein [Orbaceae bacterium ESL0727]|nr:phage tail protein [Orbaceae bacterium ESL0727]